MSLKNDIKNVIFSPKEFLKERFLHITEKRIYKISYIAVLCGFALSGIVTYYLANWVKLDYKATPNRYAEALNTLGLDSEQFLLLLNTQLMYGILILCLSPIIAYVAPHIFGGILHVLLKLTARPQKIELEFHRTMECSAIALSSMFYYFIPLIGSILAIVMLCVNMSRALSARYGLFGFIKVINIIMSVYIGFMLISGTLQILSSSLAG